MEPTNKPEVVSSFDAARSELPEGIAIDNEGNIYVSLGPPLFVGGGFGEIWKISPDGTTTTLAQFEGGPPAAGLAVDASGNLYYAYPSGEEETQGVYRLTSDGDSERLPGTEAIILANGLAFDNDASLFVSDSIPGAIWRIPSGGSAEMWLQHDLLAGCLPDDPFGANGVALWDGKLYAANTGKGILVSVPILPDGSAGEPEMAAGVGDCDAEIKDLYGMDGIALDVEENIYALLVLQSKLVKIDPADGASTLLLSGEDGLHEPASVTFGIGEVNQSILFTNYAVLPPVPPASPGPAVLRVDVGDPTIIWKLAFSHDSSRLAVGYDSGADVGGQVVIWQLPGPDAGLTAEPEIALQFEHNTGWVAGVNFSPDDTVLSVPGLNRVSLHDAQTGASIIDLFKPSGANDAVFSPDGRMIALSGNDGFVHLMAANLDELLTLANSRLTRKLTTAECQEYLHVDDCPNG